MNGKPFIPICSTAAAALIALSAVTIAEAEPSRMQHALSNSVTFPVSPPADPNAPNIASVVVSNDDTGLLTFRVEIPNRPELLADMDIGILLDTDQNASTGDPDSEGADYMINLAGNDVALASWNGSTFDFAKDSPASLIYSYANGATIKIKISDLGKDLQRFNFYVFAISGIAGTADNPDFSNAHVDYAPAQGHADWSYQVKLTPVQLTVARFLTVPAAPRAGQAYTVGMVVGGNVPAALAQDARVSCMATIGGTPVKPVAQGFSNQTARCAWQIPRNARGKTISGSVVVSAGGLQVSRRFSAKVR
jgi:hypothetical protein